MSGKSLHVLVIDDSKTVRNTMRVQLSQLGHEVHTADNGMEALQQVAQVQPDIIFCDYVMPGLDGYKTCFCLKQHPRCQKTPVIILSGFQSPFEAAKAKLMGADEVLTKPVAPEQLDQIMQHYQGAV